VNSLPYGSAPYPKAAEVVALLLAGLLSEANASQRLGIDSGHLGSLLDELGLVGTAIVPFRIDEKLDTYYVGIGRSSFAPPRFDDMIDQHCRADTPADGPTLRLSADSIVGAAAAAAPTNLSGLIFHVGRCGSTILCNLLVSVGGWVALKEPEFINRLLLRLATERDATERERVGALIALLLRSLAHGVRFDADGRERACVVKLTSWNTILADGFVGRLHPIPLVVVTRDPWATVASSLHELPSWYCSRPTQAANRASASETNELASLFAQEWSRNIDAALRLPPQTLFVSYAELVDDPAAVLSRVRFHLGDGRENQNVERVGEVMRQYSKAASHERFEPRGRHQRSALDAQTRDLVTTITARSWSELIERTGPAEHSTVGRKAGPSLRSG
jgi:hypothetical protein